MMLHRACYAVRPRQSHPQFDWTVPAVAGHSPPMSLVDHRTPTQRRRLHEDSTTSLCIIEGSRLRPPMTQ
jgi:hypothetical protein